jgi:hypothetical protein
VEGADKGEGERARGVTMPQTYETDKRDTIPRVPRICSVVEGARLKGVGSIHVCSHAGKEDHCTRVTVERRPVHCCPVHACSVPEPCLSFAPHTLKASKSLPCTPHVEGKQEPPMHHTRCCLHKLRLLTWSHLSSHLASHL